MSQALTLNSYLFHDLFGDVEHALLLKSEAVDAIRSIEQGLDVLPDVLGELLEEDLGLLFRQRPHLS